MDELPFPKTLSTLQRAYLVRLVDALNNMGVQFAIVEPDGTAHGNGVLEEKKGRTRIGSILAYGAMTAYIGPLIEDMKPGQVREIPCPDFMPTDWEPIRRVRHLQKSVTSYCSNHWGNKSYMTTVDEVQLTVEVLRTEGTPNE